MGRPEKVVEREVKLGVPSSFVLADVVGSLVREAGDGASAPRVVDLGERRLTATYWDTADLRLTRSGLSLRHRSAGDGSERGWTVKLPAGGAAGPVLDRSEVAFSGPDSQPPAEAAALVTATTRGRPLEPVARLVTKRRRRHVLDADGRVALEVCDDLVSVMDGRRVADRFRELEVELAPGGHDGPALLPLVVERLRDGGAGAPDPTPKIARALGPRAAEPPDIEVGEAGPKDTAAAVVQAAIAAGTRRLVAHDPGVRVGGDDEDVHQARVATRRLRSDLATFGPLLDRGWVADVRGELGWLAGELGAARDADVLLERLQRQAALLAKADAVAATALLRVLEDERRSAAARAANALVNPRYVALLDQLVAASRMPPLKGPAEEKAADIVRGLVGKAWRHLAKAVDQAGDDPPAELLHEVRKKAKRCRYACEAAAGVCGKDAKQLAAAVAGIQEVLGELQDAAVAELWLRSRAVGLKGSGAAGRAFSAGLLTAMQQQAANEATRSWRAAWEAASARKLRKWLA
ncbi:MAG: CYTH and CHAD domain-containing protein [Acidimicrobiales bacterium]